MKVESNLRSKDDVERFLERLGKRLFEFSEKILSNEKKELIKESFSESVVNLNPIGRNNHRFNKTL